MNLNDRIERIYRSAEGTNNAIELTKQLLLDVLEYVKPELAPFREDDDLDRGTNIGFRTAVAEMEAKIEELHL